MCWDAGRIALHDTAGFNTNFWPRVPRGNDRCVSKVLFSASGFTSVLFSGTQPIFSFEARMRGGMDAKSGAGIMVAGFIHDYLLCAYARCVGRSIVW
jgi:hypothetical protein